MTSHWRFVDTGAKSGVFNMQFDEQLARDLQTGIGRPTLRLFQWHPWAISLGFNQDVADIDVGRCRQAGFDIVRRPTGGRAILHAEELTYSVVMPVASGGSTEAGGTTGRKSVLGVYNEISRALVRGLQLFGVDAVLQRSQPNFAEKYRQPSSIPCFTSSARYEIEWNGKKLVGSAQRRFHSRHGEVVLQHGSILAGPSHRRLADCLTLRDERALGLIRQELIEKTTDLSEITRSTVDLAKLGRCLKQGFEAEWGIRFETAPSVIPVFASAGAEEQPT